MQTIKEWVNNKNYYPYIFPIIIFLFLTLLTIFKVNGSSSGSIKQIFGPNIKDSSIIFGESRQIRSDEWATGTPLIISQKKLGFSQINKAVGDGQDMSVLIDVPTNSWDSIFKPQNYMFFILPFEMAFSFRWWFMLALLLISGYLVLRLFLPPPLRNLRAALLSVALSFAPFVMWWYSGGTLLTMAYSLLIVFSIYMLINTEKLSNKLAFSLLIFYCLVALALTFYIPFIMASVFSAAFVLLSLISIKGIENFKKTINVKNITILVSALLMAAIILALFYIQHKQAISLIQSTVYPGKRIVSEAPIKINESLDVFSQFFLQFSSFTKNNLINQSESSNFLYFSIYFSIVIGYFLIKDYKNKKPYWPLIILMGGAAILFLRLFVPVPTNWLFKLFMMDGIPKTRLFIGLGIMNIFIIATLSARINKEKGNIPNSIIISNLSLTAIILLYQFNIFTTKYSISSKYMYAIFIISLCILLVTYLILNKKTQIYGLIGLALLAALFSFKINPINIGVIYYGDVLVNAIDKTNKSNPGTWVVIESLPLENYPTMAGANNISGVMLYPQFSIWKDFTNIGDYNNEINRYAHISFSLNNVSKDTIHLVAPDYYNVSINPCGDFAQNNIKYYLSTKEFSSECLKTLSSIKYFQTNVIIYQTTPKLKQ